MEIARHWRLRKDRYNLRGERRELKDGTEQFRLNGSNNWTEPRPNGHHEGENPLEGTIIYQAQTLPGDNGREPIEIHGLVEIPVSSG